MLCIRLRASIRVTKDTDFVNACGKSFEPFPKVSPGCERTTRCTRAANFLPQLLLARLKVQHRHTAGHMVRNKFAEVVRLGSLIE